MRGQMHLCLEAAEFPPSFFLDYNLIYSERFTDCVGRKHYERMKEKRQKIALERISCLVQMAEEQALSGKDELADRYMYLARKIGMRYNVRMPKGYKLMYCKDCGAYLIPSKKSRIRLTGRHITRHCTVCGAFYRIPIKKGR